MGPAGTERRLRITYPDSPDWDDVRGAWNLAADQQPDAVVIAASLDAGYAVYAVGIAMTPELAAASEAHGAAVRRALAPWEARHTYLEPGRDAAWAGVTVG